MVREEVDAAGNSDRSPGTPGRSVHLLVIRCLASTAAANEQDPSWIEADPFGRDAPISVWWDHPPAGDT